MTAPRQPGGFDSGAPRRETRERQRQRPRASRRLALLLLGAVLALCAWEVGATLRQHLGAPTDADFRAAAEKLRPQHRPDEPILFAPHWMDPLGRRFFGELVPFELLLLSDVDRYPRVWLVSVRGHRHPWLGDLRPKKSFEVGPVRVELYEKPADEVLYDFTRSWDRARVERVGDQVVSCPRQGDRFACDPRAGWNSVKSQLAEVGHRPYRCIYAHPVEGQLMRIHFPAVPLGKRIVGYTGIDDFENRKRSEAPVMLTVRVGGRPAGTIAHQSQWPWRRFEIDTSPEDGQRAEVVFEVGAEKAYARSFCFAAEARR
jgi:hypothetical protein